MKTMTRMVGQHRGARTGPAADPVHRVEDVGQGQHGGAHDASRYRAARYRPARCWRVVAILSAPQPAGRKFMPIATPEVYAEMLGRAKENAFAFPAINCTSSETINAAIKGFADAGSDGIIQFSTGGAEFALRPRGSRTWSSARWRWPSSPTSSRPNTRSTSRCTPTTARRTSWTPTSARCWRSRPSGSAPAGIRCSSRTCGTARRCRSTRTWQIAQELLKAGRGRQDHPRDRDRRRRRRGGRRRRRDRRQAVHHAGGLREDRRRAGPRRARQVPAGGDVRQRARRLQAGQRQAAPRHPGPGPEGRGRPSSACPTTPSRSTSCSTAVRVRRSPRSRRRWGTAWSR